MPVRVRFAPSPTGFLHLGGARTALFNFLFARANRGQCVLRVEDTDRDRYVPGSVERLEESLKWFGIEFDESPSQGGRFGPYLQSERLRLYQQSGKELVQKGAAYRCFCSRERLKALRAEGHHSGYDRQCRGLSSRQVEERLRMGLPHTVRLKVPLDSETVIKDTVYGEVKVQNITVDDQVLLKADGHPTYHLAHVVDDHCMEISHVLRGEEWLLSTAKHLLLYKGLGWEPPVFVHLPLLLASSGGKLSKRNQDMYVESYKVRGFLPEAVVNFIALLGWSPKGENELFTLGELTDAFSLVGVNKKAAIVDEEKLLWMNKQHFKKKLQNPSELQHLAVELQNHLRGNPLASSIADSRLQLEYLQKVLLLLEERISLLPEIPKEASYFWMEPTLQKESLLILDNPAAVLSVVRDSLQSCDFTKEVLTSSIKEFATNLSVPFSKLMMLCRHAIVGSKSSTGLVGIMELLGRQTVLQRLDKACHVLGRTDNSSSHSE